MTAQPAGQLCGCPIFTTHTTHGNPWCQCGHQYSSHTSPGAACTMLVADEHHAGTLNLTGQGNPNCPLAPHHHLMETCECGYEYTYPAPDDEHRPIGVRSTDVGAFIRCSCGGNPTPHYWLKAHWPGDKSEGERLLRELAREIGGGE